MSEDIMRSTMSEKVYEVLKEKIIYDQIPNKEKITEQGIAKQLKVSPTPVREAFKRLTSEGFLEQVPYKGVFLKEYSQDDIREAYLVRQKLQGVIIQLLIEKIKDEEIELLEKELQNCLSSEEENIFVRLHSYYEMIFHLAKSNVVMQSLLAINALINIDILKKVKGSFDNDKYIFNCLKLMDTIKKRHITEAIILCEEMVNQTMEYVLQN